MTRHLDCPSAPLGEVEPVRLGLVLGDLLGLVLEEGFLGGDVSTKHATLATQIAQCLPRRDAVVSVENQTSTTDTAAPYHHAQQLNQLTTAVITGNRRGIFFHEESNIKIHM